MIAPVLYASGRKDWKTPPELFSRLHARYLFTIDVCASAANAMLPRYFSPKQNGLSKSWEGERCFMNPPYGRDVKAWIQKASSGEADIVCGLLPARVDVAWWHDYVVPKAATIEFLRGRVQFVGADNGAPFPSVVVTWLGPRLNIQPSRRQRGKLPTRNMVNP